jgi:Cys-tRNA(Pro)/Cys-tRNA(Cys) deacylase
MDAHSAYSAYDTIIARLKEEGISFTIHQHAATRTVNDAEENLPFPKESFLKTVVFKLKNAGWILAALKGQDSVDYRKLATACGTKRSDIIRPSAEEVETALGYEIGGVCPIPLSNSIAVVFDSEVVTMDTVYCGSGRNDRTLEIKLRDLLRISGEQVHSFARE